jgi:hypothetical protein
MSESSGCLGEDDIAALLAGPRDDAAFAELDAHVDRCPECRALFVTLARTALTARDASDEPEPVISPPNDALARGTRVGRYEIDAMVGAGAMGAVYAAFDPALQRTVALKLVRARWGDAFEWTERLLREARTMAKLVHPNVVAVHDVGTIGGVCSSRWISWTETPFADGSRRLARGRRSSRRSSPLLAGSPRRTTRRWSTAISSRRTCSWAVTAACS